MYLLQVISLLKGNLQIKREMTVSAASRVMTGPEVLGCRPVLATFQEFKDRDEVLRKAGVFKGNNIHVTEDMSRLYSILCGKLELNQTDSNIVATLYKTVKLLLGRVCQKCLFY